MAIGLNLRRHLVAVLLVALAVFLIPNYRVAASPDMTHPRLLFTPSDLQALREKVKNGFPQRVWTAVLAAAEEAMPVMHPVDLSQVHDPYGEIQTAATHIEYLSFAYLMTNDTRYAAKVKEIMWVVLNWNEWIAGGFDPETSGICLFAGIASTAIAIGYDWLYGYLTNDERVFVQQRAAEKGAGALYEATIQGRTDWFSHPYNIWAAVYSGMGLLGLAFLGEHPDAPKWLDMATSKIQKYLAFGGSNGGWGEGLHYYLFALEEAVLFVDSLRRVTGQNLYESSFLKETLYFPIYLYTPGLKRHANFGDTWQSPDEELGRTAELALRLSSEYKNGYGQEFFNQVRKEYEFEEGRFAWKWAVGPFVIIWYDASMVPTPLDKLPLSRLFEGLGWVIVRSGWGSYDAYLAFKSGPNWNHGHADQNNFIFEALGEPLIVDLGAGVYSTAYWESMDYHVTSLGHNVILFDGQGQVDPRPTAGKQTPSGKIMAFQSYAGSESYEYMVGDASSAYQWQSKFIRQIVFVQHRFLVILDSMTTFRPSHFQWLAHTTGRIDSMNDTFTLIKGNVDLTIKFLLPNGLDSSVYYDQNRQITWSKRENAPRLEVSNKDPMATATFLAVLYPTKVGGSLPRISLNQNSSTWIVMIEDNETHYLFFTPGTPYPNFQATRSQVASLQATAPQSINMAEGEISKAQLEGRTVGLEKATKRLDDAKAAYAAGDYDNAIQLAVEAVQLARKSTTATLNTTSIAQTSTGAPPPSSMEVSLNPAILLVATAAVGIVAVCLAIRRKKRVMQT
jgi:hypothetical protein